MKQSVERTPSVPEDNSVCCHCIGEEYLAQEVKSTGLKVTCSYCGGKARGFTLTTLVEKCETALLSHYQRTPEQPSDWDYFRQHVDKESNYYWVREGETVKDILMDVVGISQELANDVAEVLKDRYYDHEASAMGEESEFGSDTRYEPKGFSDENWKIQWDKVARILKSESRFFNKTVSDYLESVFEGIEQLKSYDRKSIVKIVGPKQTIKAFYRARVFQSEDKLLEALKFPDKMLGTPPPAYASSGRMNAKGVGVFYGSLEEATALSEVRPPVGSRVVITRFNLLRKLRLLDLVTLRDVSAEGSIFDPSYVSKIEKAMFLKYLSELMVMPVMPDHESFEYLPTQVIADFLASRSDDNYDGIIFPSVQGTTFSNNVVLFHKAARVESIELQEGTTLYATSTQSDEDDEYTSYAVLERRDKKSNRRQITEFYDERYGYVSESRDEQDDMRKVTLKVDLDGIYVEHVKGVKFDTDAYSVKRRAMKPISFKKPPGIPDL